MLELYKNIKKRRIELGMTQEELAKRMGYSEKSMISKIEAGKIDIPQSKIVAFSRVLDTTPANLMGWHEGSDLPSMNDKSNNSYDESTNIRIGNNLRNIREHNGMTQKELANRLNVRQTAISYWETGKRQPDLNTIIKISEIFNVNLNAILDGNDNKTSVAEYKGGFGTSSQNPFGHYRIPVLTTVAAGKPIYAEEDVIEWIDYDKDPGDHVRTCRIEGNSMIPRIQDGDTVIFDTDLGWEDGDVVIATVNGDHATCKRIKRYADGIALLSDNADMRPMYFSRDEVVELPVKIVGRVIEVRGKI